MSLSEDRIQQIALNRLVPDPENVNTHNEININQIMASIRRFGFLDPIGVVRHPSRRGHYMIVEGHGRFDAATELGMTDVPCIVLTLDEAERKGYAIAHNQIQQITPMDMAAVAEEFKRLDVGSGDYISLGFSEEDVLFMPGMRDVGEPFAGDNWSAPDGGEYQERDAGPGSADAKIEDNGIGANRKAWAGYIPPVHRTSLRFASDLSYNRFTHMLSVLRTRYPLAGTNGERLQLLLTDMGFPANLEVEAA
jgi:hypothetical protein